MNFLASLDSSMEIPLSEDSCSNSWNIAFCCHHCLVSILRPLMILVIMGLICDFLQSTDCMMIGRKEMSMAASLHLNLGSKVESQGYPKIRSSPPRSVMRNFMTSCQVPVWTSKSTQCVSAPALLVVPLMFHIFHSLPRSWLPRPSRLSSFGWMKLPVAPESTKIFLSAMACRVRNETGTFIERYVVIYTDLQPIALAQAVGFERPKNPPSWRTPIWWCPSHCLLPPSVSP